MIDYCTFCDNEAVYLDEPKMCHTCKQAFNSGFEKGYKFKFDAENKA